MSKKYENSILAKYENLHTIGNLKKTTVSKIINARKLSLLKSTLLNNTLELLKLSEATVIRDINNSEQAFGWRSRKGVSSFSNVNSELDNNMESSSHRFDIQSADFCMDLLFK